MSSPSLPNYPHLQLIKTEYSLPRKKRKGGGGPSARYHKTHAKDLIGESETIEEEFEENQAKQPPQFDPALIFCVHLDSVVEEKKWGRTGLHILSTEPNKATILFSSDNQLNGIRRKIEAYGSDIPENRKNPSQNWLSAISSMEIWGPQHRKGYKLRRLTISPEELYVLDVEIWYFDTRDACLSRLAELKRFIQESGQDYYDDYIGSSICLARVRVTGAVLEKLLLADPVASVDLPPQPQLSISSVFQKRIDDFPPIPQPPSDAARICIIDTGLERGHPILGPAIGDTSAAPELIGSHFDEAGHGTMVGGLALYGDLTESIEKMSFKPELRLFSVRVTNDQGQFDDDRLIVNQMKEAIDTMYRGYGCRIFNISLGDDRHIFTDNEKPTYWATILDELAREYDVVIVVSTGNYRPVYDGDNPEAVLDQYPKYLFKDEARLIDPAMGVNILTVGSLALEWSTYASEQWPNDPAYIPIARPNQPSPFTRRGPGVEQAIKPDLCEYGGNLVYDGRAKTIKDNDPGAGIVSTYHGFGQGRLFGYRYGSSFAAPRVAHMAAQVLSRYPEASANLIRALLANSAEIPAEARELIGFNTADQKKRVLQVCGYGKPDFFRAIYSTDYRVTLISQDQLRIDHFHIYEVPIPDELKETRGNRRISVTLAFDPPVRRTRRDYIGRRMSFRLIRGLSLDQIIEFYKDRKGQDLSVEPPTTGQTTSNMWPKYNLRHPGTLQKSVLFIKNKRSLAYEEPFRLVVWCEGRWAKTEYDLQRYAIVTTIEHLDNHDVNIYNVIQEQAMLPLPMRVRI